DYHPVTCVSWQDAKAYVGWLSTQTGRDYRMLSEAEWEYAARARTAPGSYPRFYFGDDEAGRCSYGNGGGPSMPGLPILPVLRNKACSDGVSVGTAPVGQYKPNAFGLYDMLGNVSEWVEDCFHDSYIGAPTDGAAWTSGRCIGTLFAVVVGSTDR